MGEIILVILLFVAHNLQKKCYFYLMCYHQKVTLNTHYPFFSFIPLESKNGTSFCGATNVLHFLSHRYLNCVGKNVNILEQPLEESR